MTDEPSRRVESYDYVSTAYDDVKYANKKQRLIESRSSSSVHARKNKKRGDNFDESTTRDNAKPDPDEKWNKTISSNNQHRWWLMKTMKRSSVAFRNGVKTQLWKRWRHRDDDVNRNTCRCIQHSAHARAMACTTYCFIAMHESI